MTEQTNFVPKRRFKEFHNTRSWKLCKLGKLCDEFQSGKNIKSMDISVEGRYPVFGGNGLRGYTNTYNHDGLYALIGRQGALCGNMNISYGKAYFTEHAIAVKGNKNNETRFLFYLLGEMNLGQYSGQSAQPGLAVNKLKELSAYIPTFAEQAQISTLFQKLDFLIALHQRKLEKMKALKSAYLFEMFPAEGEFVPKRRFAGFTQAWEQRKLNTVFKNFIVPMRDKPREFSGTVPWTRIEDIEGRFINGTTSGQYVSEETIKSMNLKVIPKGSLIVSASATFGVVAIVNNDLITNQTFIGLVPNANYNIDYLYAFFKSKNIQKKMKKESAGSTIFYISREQFENMIGEFPIIEEQEKIGEFFKKTDNMIALQQRKLDKLQNIKKAYLNEMFV